MRNIHQTNPEILEDQWNKWLLVAGLVVGIFVRLLPVVTIDFPLHDGGMFYTIVEHLTTNSMQMPDQIDYNSINVPLVYPPLGFIITGAITNSLRITAITAIQYVPSLFSVVTLVVFYYLSKSVLGSIRNAALATTIFSLIPRSYVWLIFGGGITRAPGFVFFMLTVLNTYSLFYCNENKRLKWVAIFGALTVLSHPDAAIHTVAQCGFLWLYSMNKTKNLISGLKISIFVLMLSSPWWVSVLIRYGMNPFLAASKTSDYSAIGFIKFLFFPFSEEYFFPILTIFAFLGGLFLLFRKDYLLSIWLIVPFITHPRSAATYATIPLAMLGAIFVNDLLIPAIKISCQKSSVILRNWDIEDLKISRIVVGVLLIYSFTSNYFFITMLRQEYVLSECHQQAMSFVKENTPAGSRFLIMTGNGTAFQDPVKEWFPALSNRIGVNTAQGKEWIAGYDFSIFIDANMDLEKKCFVAGDLDCVAGFLANTDLGFDYYYIQINTSKPERSISMIKSLSELYPLIYQNDEVQIFLNNQFASAP